MPLVDFVRSVRTGTVWVHPGPGADPDPADLERAALWLAPDTLAGYDPADFAEMPQREELSAAVGRFRRAADGPATEDRYRDGLAAFADVLRLLDEQLFDADEWRVYDVIWPLLRSPMAGLRELVVGADFQLRPDSSGDPAAVIWLVVPDEVDVTEADFQALMMRTRPALRRAFAAAGIDRWPFVRVRSVSEVRELADTPAEVA